MKISKKRLIKKVCLHKNLKCYYDSSNYHTGITGYCAYCKECNLQFDMNNRIQEWKKYASIEERRYARKDEKIQKLDKAGLLCLNCRGAGAFNGKSKILHDFYLDCCGFCLGTGLKKGKK